MNERENVVQSYFNQFPT